MEENRFKLPTEMVELPSKGLLYPEGNPLREGKIEMKYMTAKEEDILTNQNYIKQGLVVDKLLQSLIVTKINYNDLLIGDKNAIMIAARVLSYGASYEFEYDGIKQEDLAKSQLDLDGKQPLVYDRQSNYATDLAVSQLDLNGLAPKVNGKLPYLDNLPR